MCGRPLLGAGGRRGRALATALAASLALLLSSCVHYDIDTRLESERSSPAFERMVVEPLSIARTEADGGEARIHVERRVRARYETTRRRVRDVDWRASSITWDLLEGQRDILESGKPGYILLLPLTWFGFGLALPGDAVSFLVTAPVRAPIAALRSIDGAPETSVEEEVVGEPLAHARLRIEVDGGSRALFATTGAKGAAAFPAAALAVEALDAGREALPLRVQRAGGGAAGGASLPRAVLEALAASAARGPDSP